MQHPILLVSMPSGEEFMFIGFAIMLIAFPILIAAIFYLIALQNTFKVISPHNRLMRPGQVWLELIPIFGSIWTFFVVSRLSDSIAAECRQRGIPVDGRPTYTTGLAFAILSVCGFIPVVGFLASIAGLVCWIMHWIQVVEWKRKIESAPLADSKSAIFGAMPGV